MSTSDRPYVHVEPREHDKTCEYAACGYRPRGETNVGGGFDTEHCERCRNLTAHLQAASERRKAARS